MGPHHSKDHACKHKKYFVGDGEDFLSPSNESDPDIKEEGEEYKPALKWHRANPNDDMIKIQQAAEIKDIETIYENTQIKKNELLSKMPDHYWVGRDNKLPRYVEYRGDHPNFKKRSNLKKLKSSSYCDLSDSLSLNVNFNNKNSEEDSVTDKKNRATYYSCPELRFDFQSVSSLSKENKSEPIKGILKKRTANRPISAMFTEINIKSQSQLQENFIPIEESNLLTLDVIPPVCIDTADTETNFVTLIENVIDSSEKENCMQLCDEINFPDINGDECISPVSGYFDEISNNYNVEFSNIDAYQTPVSENQKSFRVNIRPNALKVNERRKQMIKLNLDKRLTLRPSSSELTDRNILHAETETERNSGKEMTITFLNEKLSSRPTINELKKKKIIKFNDFIEVKETDNYDRSVNKTWARLTDYDREYIRNELNELKKEMIIHDSSKINTRFHDPMRG